jgi:aspartyl protease family protein
MMVKELGVVAIATLSALTAGGGVLAGARYLHAGPEQGRIARSADGHYWADAEVDGAPVHFLVDTGSSTVALTPADAGRLGLDAAALNYDQPVFTAAGRERAAAVTLSHVTIAGVKVEGVKALVMREGLSASLLGMSYLGRLSKIEATPEALVLSR